MSIIRELGLTGYEEKVYRALLAKELLAVKEISLLSQVPPTAVYPTLQSLIEKGLVQRVDDQVQHYQALNPKVGLHNLLKKKIERLEEVKSQAVLELEKITKDEAILPTPIQLSKGHIASQEQREQLIEKTTKTFYILGWNLRRKGASVRVIRQVRQLKKQGIDVRLIFTHLFPEGDICRKELKKLDIPYRFVPMGYISLIVSDAKRCKITLKQKALPDRLNMLVDDESLAQALHAYYLSLWKKGKKEF